MIQEIQNSSVKKTRRECKQALEQVRDKCFLATLYTPRVRSDTAMELTRKKSADLEKYNTYVKRQLQAEEKRSAGKSSSKSQIKERCLEQERGRKWKERE